ncbi:MAG: cell envelope integrity protein TolA [Kiritimatiellae bacterium]|nr:cell envelope integrity protein TolA [Kiritimatiellia bacterium]
MTEGNMPKQSRPRLVAAFRLKLWMLRALRRLALGAAVWLFVLGTVVLVLRVATRISRGALAWGFAGLVPVFVLALLLEWRRRPSCSAVNALLDVVHACGGLVMADEETDIGAWRERLPPLTPPRVRWRGERLWLLLAAGAVFAAVAYAVPSRYVVPGKKGPMEIGNVVEDLESRIQVLEEEAVLEETRAEEILEKLEKLKAESRGDDPAKTLEALDHIEQLASDAARKSAEEVQAAVEPLAKAEALAQALEKLAGQRMEAGAVQADPGLLANAMKELAALMENEALAKRLAQTLPPELLDACRCGQLTPEQLKALAECLGTFEGELTGRLVRLCEARLIDAERLCACTNAACYDPDALALLLAKGGECDKAGIAAALAGSMPGQGGVNRGRGDAPMTWTEGTSEQGARFKEQGLPPGKVATLKDSELVGLSAGAPSVTDEPIAARAGTLSAGDGHGAAHTQTVLPRHRGAVKRYFEREK